MVAETELPVLVPLRMPPEEDPVCGLLARTVPWLTHGEMFAEQLFGVGAWPAQGWKLHISATPLSAVEVLSRSLPVLLDAGVRFKVVTTRERLLALNAGLFGTTQVGKFITIYPSDDEMAVRLAVALDAALVGLRGPRVPTDRPLRPRSLVHYRYGAFRGQADLTGAMGGYELLDHDGRRRHDRRVPLYLPPNEVIDPFEASGVYEPLAPRAGALAGRYLVIEVLGRSWRGGVFRAIDLGTHPPRICLLKEFWRDVGTDRYGRDVRAWGENEADLLTRHAGDPWLPRCYDRFALDENRYIVLEYVEGETLDRTLRRRGGLEQGLASEELAAIGCALAQALARLHDAGIVYRDLKPGNIVQTPEGGYRLVDFGIAFESAAQRGPPLGLGTLPYCGPEQTDGAPPTPADDVFSWGAVMHQLACPHASISMEDGARNPSQPVRREPLGSLRPDLSPAICAVVDRALSWGRDGRYADAGALCTALETALSAQERCALPPPAPLDDARAKEALPESTIAFEPLMLARAVGDALCRAAEEQMGGLCWATHNPLLADAVRSPDLYDGAAGIALFLAELARATGEPRYAEAAKGAACWLAGPIWGEGRALPGLHCGEAGVGYLFLRLASLLNEPGYIAAAELRARRLAGIAYPTLDLFFGAAGAATFFARLAQATGAERYLAQARDAGGVLLHTAQTAPGGAPGLFWEVAATDPSLRTMPYLSLAHGAAGIGLALVELARAGAGEHYLAGARGVAVLLLDRALTDPSGNWRWRASLNDVETGLQAHCHGAGGIGQFLLRLARLAPDERLLAAARGAAATVGRQLEARPCSGICHGLAGDGAFFLDCYQAFGEPHYLELARQCGRRLDRFRHRDQAGIYRLGRGTPSSPDLLFGSAGVGAFFLRLADPETLVDLILA